MIGDNEAKQCVLVGDHKKSRRRLAGLHDFTILGRSLANEHSPPTTVHIDFRALSFLQKPSCDNLTRNDRGEAKCSFVFHGAMLGVDIGLMCHKEEGLTKPPPQLVTSWKPGECASLTT